MRSLPGDRTYRRLLEFPNYGTSHTCSRSYNRERISLTKLSHPRGGTLIISTHKRAIVAATAVVLLLIIAASAGLHGAFENVVDWLKGHIARHPVLSGLAFVGLSAISVPFAGVSSLLIVPVGVRYWGEAMTVALLWTGWVLGGMLTYFIGRGVGAGVARWVVSRRKVKYYQERITDKASFPLVLLFQASLPSEIPGYVLGTVKYPFLSYLIALTVVELPFAAGAVFLGDSFLKRRYWLMIVVGTIAVAFMIWATTRLNRSLSHRT